MSPGPDPDPDPDPDPGPDPYLKLIKMHRKPNPDSKAAFSHSQWRRVEGVRNCAACIRERQNYPEEVETDPTPKGGGEGEQGYG